MAFILGRQQRKKKSKKLIWFKTNTPLTAPHLLTTPLSDAFFWGGRVGPSGPVGDILALLKSFHREMHIGTIPVPITT